MTAKRACDDVKVFARPTSDVYIGDERPSVVGMLSSETPLVNLTIFTTDEKKGQPEVFRQMLKTGDFRITFSVVYTSVDSLDAITEDNYMSIWDSDETVEDER